MRKGKGQFGIKQNMSHFDYYSFESYLFFFYLFKNKSDIHIGHMERKY